VASTRTVHGDFESDADLPHPLITEPSETLDKDGDRDTLDRVEIDPGSAWDRIVAGFEQNLTGQSADCRRARSDQGAPKSRDGGVT
jgi:hypothetical protein